MSRQPFTFMYIDNYCVADESKQKTSWHRLVISHDWEKSPREDLNKICIW